MDTKHTPGPLVVYHCPHCESPAGLGHNYGCPEWLRANQQELAALRAEVGRLAGEAAAARAALAQAQG